MHSSCKQQHLNLFFFLTSETTTSKSSRKTTIHLSHPRITIKMIEKHCIYLETDFQNPSSTHFILEKIDVFSSREGY